MDQIKKEETIEVWQQQWQLIEWKNTSHIIINIIRLQIVYVPLQPSASFMLIFKNYEQCEPFTEW